MKIAEAEKPASYLSWEVLPTCTADALRRRLPLTPVQVHSESHESKRTGVAGLTSNRTSCSLCCSPPIYMGTPASVQGAFKHIETLPTAVLS